MLFVEKSKTTNPYKRFDYLLFGLVLILAAIGLVVFSSAVKDRPNLLKPQVLGLIMGVALCLILSAIDYKDLKVLSLFIFFGAMGLMVLVLFFGSGEELGNKNWISIAGMSVQPSEYAKIAYIILASVFLERIKDSPEKNKADILKFLAYSCVAIGFVLLQKDLGTAMVFVFIFFLFIYIAGIPYRYIFILLGVVGLSLPFIWVYVLNENRRNRILTFISPERDPQGGGYNVIRSKLAIGSGRLFGQGYGSGLQTQSGSVPVNESDFIFSVVGEELGFIGGCIIILLGLLILLRIIYISKNASDSYGSFICIGVAGMMGFNFIENIGMSMGLLPVTGLPLPFVSQGGTAMLANFMAVGIVLSVSLRRKRGNFNSS
ncbi:rod shape-determining protein RodA [Ruminiclostridium cellobioparum]|uniref:Bacterial cell division membrane protein n=1 Tax=Ruminiclostridium cellobioparum subsp. termitidis CT1112 TaxID=1195236 RepID=S0FWQ8_RUMCE|nr:rod shape-determining protein RodA [Ruminiclostridium cellobioparum]EMS72988.1 Bacterial cell division membrane protein [Ruminiclostridium cellobioparum subsp. termitidis CT1112]